jgi:adenosine deaminase
MCQLAENSFTASILTPAEKVRWIGELNDFARG